MPSISYFNVRGTYTGEDIQKLKINYADLERGAKGDIKCPRSNWYFQRRELTLEEWQAKRKKGDNQASHKANKIILDRYEIVPLSLTAPPTLLKVGPKTS